MHLGCTILPNNQAGMNPNSGMIAPPHPSFYHVVPCKLKVGRKKLLERLALIRMIKSLLDF